MWVNDSNSQEGLLRFQEPQGAPSIWLASLTYTVKEVWRVSFPGSEGPTKEILRELGDKAKGGAHRVCPRRLQPQRVSSGHYLHLGCPAQWLLHLESLPYSIPNHSTLPIHPALEPNSSGKPRHLREISLPAWRGWEPRSQAKMSFYHRIPDI